MELEPQPHNASGTDTEPRDDLDVAFSIIRSSEYTELLEQINFGTGVYDESDIAMQMRNVRKGIITNVAFNETLRKRAVQETKVKLADEGFRFYDETSNEPKVWKPLSDADVDDHGRTTALFKRGEEIWASLADPKYSLSIEQAAALDEKTSLDPFKPIFHQLAAAYHEQTKSKGARTQDNFFGRVRKVLGDGEADEADGGFLGRRSN